MKGRWFLFFFRKSVSQRIGRVVIASASVTLAVAIVTGMLGVTAGIREKLGKELKAYGANIVVSAQKGDHLDHSVLRTVSALAGIEEVSGQLFGRAVISDQSVEVIGVDVSVMKDKGWRITGRWPEGDSEIMVGANVRDILSIKLGQTISIGNFGRPRDVTVSGSVERGGPEDSSVIMPLEAAGTLLGLDGKLSALLVRGRTGRLEEAVQEIRRSVPGATVKTLRQVAVAEESLLGKIQLLMTLVTAVVLFATAVSVASTMGANVLERRDEIGLMKAIGATGSEIGLFYKAESALIGLSGGLLGYMLGFVSAQVVSKGAFNSYIAVPFWLLAVSLAAGLAISLAASYFPVRDALKYNPAVILRGE